MSKFNNEADEKRYRVLVEFSDPGETTVYTKYTVTAATEQQALDRIHKRANREFDDCDASVTRL